MSFQIFGPLTITRRHDYDSIMAQNISSRHRWHNLDLFSAPNTNNPHLDTKRGLATISDQQPIISDAVIWGKQKYC